MPLPSNIHLSTHPCLQAKLSQLRSSSTSTRETRNLIHEISTILGVEAFARCLSVKNSGTDKTPLEQTYERKDIEPNDVAIVPILRSGLGMTDGLFPSRDEMME